MTPNIVFILLFLMSPLGKNAEVAQPQVNQPKFVEPYPNARKGSLQDFVNRARKQIWDSGDFKGKTLVNYPNKSEVKALLMQGPLDPKTKKPIASSMLVINDEL